MGNPILLRRKGGEGAPAKTQGEIKIVPVDNDKHVNYVSYALRSRVLSFSLNEHHTCIQSLHVSTLTLKL